MFEITKNCKLCGESFTIRAKKRKALEGNFCSPQCRNINNAHKKSMVKGQKCPVCGSVGYNRKTDFCRLHAPKQKGRTNWSEQEVAYLREHYPDNGAIFVASNLPGKSVGAVHQKANKLGIAMTPTAYRRLVHDAAAKHMIMNNPSHQPGAIERLRKTSACHPEVLAKLMAGHARIRRENPSGLEKKLAEILDSLGISYQSQYLIKPKFIVDFLLGKLIIQADGDYWHGHPRFEPLTARQLAQQKRDKAQDAYLKSCGYTVVRIWESDLTIELLQSIICNNNHINDTLCNTDN